MNLKASVSTILLSYAIVTTSLAQANPTPVIDAEVAQKLAQEKAGGGNPVGSATLKTSDAETPYYEVKLLMETGEVRVVKVIADTGSTN